MSLEAIQTITREERENREKLAAAEAKAREVTAAAERDGQALLQQVRARAAEEGRLLMQEAEGRAAKRAEEIRRQAEKDSDALRKDAGSRLDAAAELIVGKVVKR